FIDPGLHALATGHPSYNLDGWMCGREAVLASVARHARVADLAVVEGVMGCFDGIDGTGEEGSTAEIAKWLHAPVGLVVDAWPSARSAAAVVRGFEGFDPALSLAGVIVNRVGGEGHGRMVLDAIAATCRATPLGAIARDETLALPERHLGLVTAAEGVLDTAKLRRLGDAVDRSVDLDRLLLLAREQQETVKVDGAVDGIAEATKLCCIEHALRRRHQPEVSLWERQRLVAGDRAERRRAARGGDRVQHHAAVALASHAVDD